MAQSENNWLGMARPAQWPPEGDHTPTRYNGICVKFFIRTTLRETFMNKNIGFPAYQNQQFIFPSETTSIPVKVCPTHITPSPSKRTHQNMAASK